MNLPEAFVERMKRQLGEEYDAFLAGFSAEPYQGLRVNTLKCSRDAFLALAGEQEKAWTLSPVPWCENGFYYNREGRPGRHVWHEAGAYYIQEPSAMSAAALLEAQPGERILDLCAAPGGKTGQLAAAMKGEGLLVANEIHPARAKILSQNMERLGVKNVLVVNESPARLAKLWPESFDRILCDAPCSGEGMFRKDENAVKEWSPAHVQMCADRQFDEVLLEAHKLLKPGGRLVYSTCTYAEEENEQVIARFLEACPDMEICSDVKCPWFSEGGIPGTYRLWPHKLHGEGHGIAVLQKKGSSKSSAWELEQGFYPVEKTLALKDKRLQEFASLTKEVLADQLPDRYYLFGQQLYLLPEGCPPLKGVKVQRPGLQLGEGKGKVFKPAHGFAMALCPDEVKQSVSLTHQQAEAYLRGETLNGFEQKGWILVCVDGISLGWGKVSNGMLKNHYPKGLRINWQA